MVNHEAGTYKSEQDGEQDGEQPKHPLEKMPSFEELKQQIDSQETNDTSPKSEDNESPIDSTDTTPNPQEKTSGEDALPKPEESEDAELESLKAKVREALKDTYGSAVHKQISIERPDLYRKREDVYEDLHYYPEEGKPPEDEVRRILTEALPILEEYKSVFEETKQRLEKEQKESRRRKTEERKIYNYLHQAENERLKSRRSLYTAYDLSASRAIPEEYVGLTLEEVIAIEEEKKRAAELSEQGILKSEETDSTTQTETESETESETEPKDELRVEPEAESEQTQAFYEDLSIPEDEPHYSESVEIQDMIDWQSFPNEIKTELPEDAEESAKDTEQSIAQLQTFAAAAKENPPDEFGSRDIGTDDRLLLGDKYNELTTNYRAAAERRARIGMQELSPTLLKRFCHELASIIREYKEYQEIWQLVGERSLEDALNAYADIRGTDAVVQDLGNEIPEHVDRYTVLPLIGKINEVLRQDWQQKITPVESYEAGKPYSFLCSRVKEPFAAKESKNGIFSCSLLTEAHHETIGANGTFGFIFPPDHIISAAPYDTYTHNWSEDDQTSLRTKVPVIMSYDRVLRESQEEQTYSEITTRDMPVGIFYKKSEITNEDRAKLDELIRLNPGLPVIALE